MGSILSRAKTVEKLVAKTLRKLYKFVTVVKAQECDIIGRTIF
jgi:hypothetical protein